MNKDKKDFSYSCPMPITDYKNILLGHGSGGTLSNQLIGKIFVNTFDNEHLRRGHDSSVVNLGNTKIAITTDSYVIDPIFFPGGDIGSLSIHGTVNDLAMSGAEPVYISTGFIIEEGYEIAKLYEIVKSMKKAADAAGVQIVTGDTKVVDKGKGDGVFINTTGIGIIKHSLDISPSSIKEGDAIILSGDIGRHGISVMAARENISMTEELLSDSACLSHIVKEIIDAGINVNCMRDLTRGGLASALVEISKTSGKQIQVVEEKISVCTQVHSICEILGFDPMYVANEGRFICFVSDDDKEKVISIMQKHIESENASVIGKVVSQKEALVTMKSTIGTERIVDMLPGEQLPRIC